MSASPRLGLIASVAVVRLGGACGSGDPVVGSGRGDPPPVSTSKGGNTFPGAALPFGMVQWSLDAPGTTAVVARYG